MKIHELKAFLLVLSSLPHSHEGGYALKVQASNTCTMPEDVYRPQNQKHICIILVAIASIDTYQRKAPVQSTSSLRYRPHMVSTHLANKFKPSINQLALSGYAGESGTVYRCGCRQYDTKRLADPSCSRGTTTRPSWWQFTSSTAIGLDRMDSDLPQ